ncbi:MAG TPA: VOC family protein [Gammaproteobacteria bacterium]|nr:VOC family protein [Gammaproteobacteria bacterium]
MNELRSHAASAASILSGLAAAALLSLGSTSVAQAPAAGQMKSLSHNIHAVNDLDTTLAFYKDVFGLEGRATDFANPAVPLLTNAPGVTLRMSMLTLPGGPRYELTHFKGLERKPAQAKYTDPGAASVVLYVRDLDALVANAKKAKAPIVTTGGAPIHVMTAIGHARSIVIRDPDGYFLQLVEEAPPAGAPAGAIHRATLAFTMEDAAATQRFYTGMMAVPLTGPTEFKRDADLAKLYGAPETVEFRKLSGMLPPGTAVEFTEFRGVPRTKFHLRVRDPGAAAMAINVDNLEGMVAQMKAAGVNLVSANGELVDFGNGVRNIFVEDPNGLNLELIYRPAAPPNPTGAAR